jgi:glycosyltransferase involved in cell wall biosynthesis
MKHSSSRSIGIVVNEIFGYGAFGGFGMVTRSLMRLLREIGYSVFVVTVKYTGGSSVQKNIVDGCESLLLQYWSPKSFYRVIVSAPDLVQFISTKKPAALIFIEPVHYFHIALQVKLLANIASPKTKIIIDFQDTRSIEDVSRILNNQLEQRATGDPCNALKQYSRGLKITKYLMENADGYFSQATFLAEKAKKIYALKETPVVIPNPVDIPVFLQKPNPNPPTVLFLGRLDPIKRPWIFFKLAKYHPQVNFVVAGSTHFPALMEPLINNYRDTPNLSFRGLVTGQEKSSLLSSSHVLVNTSVYEALPVSFLEALAYGVPILSCQNPEGLTAKYGYYIGQINGDGDSSELLFSQGLRSIINGGWFELGQKGREHIINEYSFSKVKEKLSGYLKSLDI